jgi:formylglycine-generating enzyme required for sulfatase activity
VDYRCKDVSPYGAWHMTGNVAEWTVDPYENRAYERYARGDFAPPTRDDDKYVVKRGGQAGSPLKRGNVVYRDDQPPKHHSGRLGFRVALLSRTARPERR